MFSYQWDAILDKLLIFRLLFSFEMGQKIVDSKCLNFVVWLSKIESSCCLRAQRNVDELCFELKNYLVCPNKQARHASEKLTVFRQRIIS